MKKAILITLLLFSVSSLAQTREPGAEKTYANMDIYHSSFSEQEFLANLLIQPRVIDCLKAPGNPYDQPVVTSIVKGGSKIEVYYEVEVTSRVSQTRLLFAGKRQYLISLERGADFDQVTCYLESNEE